MRILARGGKLVGLQCCCGCVKAMDDRMWGRSWNKGRQRTRCQGPVG